MNPIEVWGQQATHWTRVSVRWVERWRDRADTRFDVVAGVSLRRWLGYVAMTAAGICVAAVAVHSLLLVALRSDVALGWLAVAAVAATAVVLLVVVVRDTVLSFATPPRRRAHLIALLVSAAALLAGVQACGAATAALAGRTVSLWQAEQLYAWRLADSVPFLAIPRRLEWSQPAVAEVPGDRVIQVAFLVALVVPLVRMVLAIYHLTGGNAAERSARPARTTPLPWTPALTVFGVRLRRSSIFAALVTATGFVVGGFGTGLGERVAAGSGLAIAGTVLVAALGGIVLAALLWIVMSMLTAVWAPISGGPWMQLVVAAGLVWIDTPVRQVLLSSVDGWGPPGKIVVTLGLWAVLTVLLLPVWVDPQLPESLLALGLLVGFAGAGAPGRELLLSTIGWTPGGFAVGPAFATALACLTGAYLLYLLSRGPARAANARLPVGGSVDLRRELGGYAYVGLQVVIAGAGALLLLYSLGAAGATASSTAMDAPRSLLAVIWHVTDSIPGPDLPASAGWHLDVDFTGTSAGSVVVATVAMLIVVVVFPMIRATSRWAKLKAGPPVLDRPLAEVPAALRTDLEFVHTFLATTSGLEAASDEHDEVLAALPEIERRLTLAELDRAKLRDLLGEESPVYWAADHAIAQATDAYRTVVRNLNGQSLHWSPWPVRGTSEAEAIAAIEVYAAAVDRWQMGADVVTEIETRVHELETREHSVQSRERDVEAREYRIDAWERGVNAREQVLELHEVATRTREHDVEERERDAEARHHALDTREQDAEARERELGPREQSVTVREQGADLRERGVTAREQNADVREQNAAERERNAEAREGEMETRSRAVTSREHDAEVREQEIGTREATVQVRERDIEEREQTVEAREQSVGTREDGLERRERDAGTREQAADERECAAEAREQSAAALEQKAKSREQNATVRDHELDARERWVEAREQNAEIREQSVVTRERNALESERKAEARERAITVGEQEHADAGRDDS